MSHLILRFLNPFGIVLLGILGVSIQTSFFTPWFLNLFEPEIILSLVIWMALRRNFVEGGILTLILSEIAEIHSSAPQGHYLLLNMAVYLILRRVIKTLYFSDRFALARLAGATFLANQIGSMLFLFLIGVEGIPVFYLLWTGILKALLEAFFSLWIFMGLDRFDVLTHKDPRSQREYEFIDESQPGTISKVPLFMSETSWKIKTARGED